MGEYTTIVWASYLVAAMLLAGCAWVTLRSYKDARQKLVALKKHDQQ